MISQTAIKEYLNRPEVSYDWIKNLSREQIDDDLNSLDPRPNFHTQLNLHQRACFLLGLARPDFVYMLEMGTGKTLVALELLNYFYDIGRLDKALILVPTNEVVTGWVDEITKWGFTIPNLPLLGSGKYKRELLQEFESGLIIGTYVGVASLVSELIPKRSKTGRVLKKEKYEIQNSLFDEFFRDIQAVVYDESTKISNYQSLSARLCRKISKSLDIRYCLVGRPFGRDPILLWSQFYAADLGKALGPTLGLFREAFFNSKPGYFGGYEYTFDGRKKNALTKLVKRSSIRYTADECIDLPQVTRIVKECVLPEPTEVYHKKVVQDLINAQGNYKEIESSFIKMRQISSGFAGFKDEDTDEKALIEFPDNPKLDLLMQLLDEMPEDKKALIFHEYTWSGSRICRQLVKNKLRHGWLWSGTKNWEKIKQSFNNDPDFRFLVINHKKGAYGLNLQVANYIFYYELPVSVIDRDQSERRIIRSGQKFRCFLYDLVMRNTVDKRILDFHKEGEDLLKSLMKNVKQALGEVA